MFHDNSFQRIEIKYIDLYTYELLVHIIVLCEFISNWNKIQYSIFLISCHSNFQIDWFEWISMNVNELNSKILSTEIY